MISSSSRERRVSFTFAGLSFDLASGWRHVEHKAQVWVPPGRERGGRRWGVTVVAIRGDEHLVVFDERDDALMRTAIATSLWFSETEPTWPPEPVREPWPELRLLPPRLRELTLW